MADQAKISMRNSTDPTYTYSHSFKLQQAILKNLDQMCVLFEVKELELEHLIESSILAYLDKRQPKKLQSAALRALENCALVDPDLVWLSMHYVIPFTSLNPTDEHLVYSTEIKQKYEYQMSKETLEGLIGVFKNL